MEILIKFCAMPYQQKYSCRTDVAEIQSVSGSSSRHDLVSELQCRWRRNEGLVRSGWLVWEVAESSAVIASGQPCSCLHVFDQCHVKVFLHGMHQDII